MWPWEHVAVAYLLCSAGTRAGLGGEWWGDRTDDDAGDRSATPLRRGAAGPTDAVAVAVVLGALFPDLVDKPLAWVVGVLPGGRSLAHSLLVAVPVVLLVGLASRRERATAVGVAFAVGYLSHLPLDVLASGVLGDGFDLGFLLWPLTPTATGPPDAPALLHVLERNREFLAFLASPVGRRYLGFEVALLSAAVIVWWLDGRPGPGWLRRRAGRLRRLVTGA